MKRVRTALRLSPLHIRLPRSAPAAHAGIEAAAGQWRYRLLSGSGPPAKPAGSHASQFLPLQAQADASLDELASLLGLAPGELDAELAGDATVPLPPAQVATDDPAEMLQRRPDIRSAERTLAARTAQIGQAEAARFPKVTLMGLIGIGGTSPSDLTHLDDYSAIIAPQLSWNFLDFGHNKSRVEQPRADRD